MHLAPIYGLQSAEESFAKLVSNTACWRHYDILDSLSNKSKLQKLTNSYMNVLQ